MCAEVLCLRVCRWLSSSGCVVKVSLGGGVQRGCAEITRSRVRHWTSMQRSRRGNHADARPHRLRSGSNVRGRVCGAPGHGGIVGTLRNKHRGRQLARAMCWVRRGGNHECRRLPPRESQDGGDRAVFMSMRLCDAAGSGSNHGGQDACRSLCL